MKCVLRLLIGFPVAIYLLIISNVMDMDGMLLMLLVLRTVIVLTKKLNFVCIIDADMTKRASDVTNILNG